MVAKVTLLNILWEIGWSLVESGLVMPFRYIMYSYRPSLVPSLHLEMICMVNEVNFLGLISPKW